jgi:hypothetical protein
MPALVGLGLSGASQATVSGFQSSGDLEVGLSGASSLRGDVKAGRARFSLSGASEMDLRGSAGDLEIHASGSSEADLSAFAVGDAEVVVSGASSVTVNPEGRLDVHASGSSEVYYLGSPTLGTLSTSGDSSVERR